MAFRAVIWFLVGILLNHEVVNSEDSYTAVINDCDQNSCITLYRHVGNISWDEAVSVCSSRGHTLLTILNRTTQDIRVNPLMAEAEIGSWVAGIQRDDPVWRYVTGAAVDGKLLGNDLEFVPSGVNCVYMNLENNNNTKVIGDECTETREGHRTVCQRMSPIEANCQADAGDVTVYVWYSGVCYIILGSQSWYQARLTCVKRQADLIKDNLDDNVLIARLAYNMSATDTGKTMWLGVTRYPWVWQPDRAMTFYNWPLLHVQPPPDGAGQHCLYVTVKGTWTASLCSYAITRYVLCLDPNIRPSSTKLPPTTPTPAPTTPAPTPEPTPAPTTPEPTTAPTPAPMPSPTPSPTTAPTTAPTPASTPAPTPSPTPSPTTAPNPAPTPAPPTLAAATSVDSTPVASTITVASISTPHTTPTSNTRSSQTAPATSGYVVTVPSTSESASLAGTVHLEYLIPGVIVGVLIIVIPVTVCLLLRKRRKSPTTIRGAPPRYENVNLANNLIIAAVSENSLTSQQDNHVNHVRENDASQYALATSGDVISPYGEFRPSKQNGDVTSEDVTDYNSSDLIDPYNIHNPTLTPILETEETLLEDNDQDKRTVDTLDARTPNLPLTLFTEEGSDVPHLETDQGNVYALSTNDKRFMDNLKESGPSTSAPVSEDPYSLATHDNTPTGSEKNMLHHVVTKDGDEYAISANDKRFPKN